MLNLKSLVTITAVGLLTLTACSQADEAVKKTEETLEKGTEAVVEKGTEAAEAVKGAPGAVAGLLSKAEAIPAMTAGVKSTIDAVKSGDFGAAKESFEKVQTSWSSLGETVKTESAETFDKINTSVEAVKTDLSAEAPDAAKITDSLTSITTALGDIKGEEKAEG